MSFMTFANTVFMGLNMINSFTSHGSRGGSDPFNDYNAHSIDEMFKKSGLSIEDMKKRLIQDSYNIEKVQHADTFLFEIARMAPAYDSMKSMVISSLVQQVDIVSNGVETEEVRVGTGFLNLQKAIQGGEVQVTFREFQDGDTEDFLTKTSSKNFLDGAMSDPLGTIATIGSGIMQATASGSAMPLFQAVGSIFGFGFGGGGFYSGNKDGSIMPTDGTHLLPYDYYFKIKMSHLVRGADGMTHAAVVLEDDFILDGNPSKTYDTSGEAHLTISATFKPITSFRGL